MYSYLNRAIIDVHFNDNDIGVSGAFGSTGIVTGVRIPFGPQTLSWRLDGQDGTPRNGDRIEVQNPLTLRREEISEKTRYLGLHIYPDFTAEIILGDDMPDRSSRGEQLLTTDGPRGSR